MDSHRTLLRALVAICVVMLVLPAFAGAAEPTRVEAGNFNCINLDSALEEIRLEPPNAGTYESADKKLKVRVFNVDGKFFDWESLPAADGETRGVDAVMVKGGTDTSVYIYDPPGESVGGTDLHSPTNSSGIAGLSHISFCYDLEQRISGVKYHDLNADGDQDQGEPVLVNPAFTFYLDLNLSGGWNTGEPQATTVNGVYSFDVAPGSYVVRELGQTGWHCSTALTTCSHAVTVGLGQSDTDNHFGNYQLGSISGTKFEDEDADGVRETGDNGLQGVTVWIETNGVNGFQAAASGNTPADLHDVTDGDGLWEIEGAVPGDYLVQEVVPAGWACTLGCSGYDVTVTSGAETTVDGDENALAFGNFDPEPGLSIVKSLTNSSDSLVHVGDAIEYTIVVTNTGNTELDVDLTDVAKGSNPEVAGCVFPAGTAMSFTLAPSNGQVGGADERTFTCTAAAPDASSYTNKACVEATDDYGSTLGGDPKICSEVETDIIKPAIAVTKTVDEDTVHAGDLLTYTIVVSNPGTTSLDVSMTDVEKGTAAAGCTFPDGTSMTFELAARASEQFECTKAMPDQDAYVNEVCVSGEDMLGGPKGSVGPECAEAQTTIVRDPAPEPEPPAQVVEPTVEEPSGQIVLGERIIPGAARLLGPSGCAGKPFRVRVAGTRVARVVFTLDGKRLQTLRRPNFRGQFAVRINPSKLRVGVHRLRATVTFESASRTRPRTMRLSFQRCARRLQAPRFTG